MADNDEDEAEGLEVDLGLRIIVWELLCHWASNRYPEVPDDLDGPEDELRPLNSRIKNWIWVEEYCEADDQINRGEEQQYDSMFGLRSVKLKNQFWQAIQSTFYSIIGSKNKENFIILTV